MENIIHLKNMTLHSVSHLNNHYAVYSKSDKLLGYVELSSEPNYWVAYRNGQHVGGGKTAALAASRVQNA